MASSTTIVFVPGAWQGPEGFDQVSQKLRDAGYQTDYVHLASVGPKEHVTDMSVDVDVIRNHVLKAIEQGQKVVLVAHSYGGVPSTEAAHGLDYWTRQKEGKSGGVTHLYFLASFVIPAGKSLIEAFGGDDLPWFRVSEDKLEVNPATPGKIFCNDLPDGLAREVVAKMKPQSYQVMHTKLVHDSWRTIPSTYQYCLNDIGLPMAVQEMMVNEFAKGVDFRTEKVDSGHWPFYSKPDEVAAAIERAAKAF